MILYQLANWMEEWKKLSISIRESKGDISLLLQKKEQVEKKLLVQAGKWLDATRKGVFSSSEKMKAVSKSPLDVTQLDEWMSPLYPEEAEHEIAY